MAKGYWKRPITLRLTAYQRKVLSEIVDGALDAGACKDGLSKLESNALTSIFQRLIGMKETAPVEDTPDEPQTAVWRPIETAPEADLTERDPETVLLWVADGGNGGKGTHAFGRCYKSHDGSIRAVASGFHGDWRITHWSPLTRPPLGGGK